MWWFLKSIGVSEEILPHLGQAKLVLQRPLVLWVGLALLVPVGVLIYRRQLRSLNVAPAWVTIALSSTRILILAMLVLALSGPYLALDYQLEKRPIVAVLFDDSASMHLPAGPFPRAEEAARIAQAAGFQIVQGRVDAEIRQALSRISRIKLAETVVQNARAVWGKPLADRYDLRYESFAGELHPLAVNSTDGTFPEPVNPGGPVTHLGGAIAQVFDEAGGRPVAGIVLFSDGQNNGGQPPAEVAHRAAALPAPIFAVPVGSTTVVPDVSVVDVYTSGQVALGDQARVTVTLQSQGLDKKKATVQLLDGSVLLDSKELDLLSADQQAVDLTFEATKPGTRYLTVQVPPLPEEPDYLRANNSDTAVIRVSREKIRVLYIDGAARWDFRFLKNAMRRDHGLGGRLGKQPEILLEAELERRPAEEVAKALPATVAEWSQYHTVILGDISPQLLDAHGLQGLEEAVRDKGLGLIVMAGPRNMPHRFPESFAELLPVRLHPRAAGLDAPVFRPFRIELTPNGALHEVMRLYEESDRNQNVWGRMPRYYWCAAVDAPAPGATVLAWNPEVGAHYGAMPLIAWHQAGQGKVLFVGTDSTWLWRQNVGDRFFYRFWGQAIRFVGRRDEARKELSAIDVRPLLVAPGEPAQVELAAFDAEGAPRGDSRLVISVTDGKSVRPLELIADPARKGRFTGQFKAGTAGDYHLTFDPGAAAAPAEAKLRVTVAAEELRQPSVNRAALELLATTSGGKLVDLADLSTIPARLKGETTLAAVHRESTVWDNWLTLVVLVTLYSFDVGLRRFRGLA